MKVIIQDSKKYKYITIKHDRQIYDGLPVYSIINNKSNTELGVLYYYKKWKQWVFTQAEQGVIFNDGCLENIIDYLKILNTQ